LGIDTSGRWHLPLRVVMAGLVPAIYLLATAKKGVDAEVKPVHEE
jgi:hypothetical protein